MREERPGRRGVIAGAGAVVAGVGAVAVRAAAGGDGAGGSLWWRLRPRRSSAGSRTGDSAAVVFREYYDLRRDPSQLTNELHGASAARGRRLGIPEPARRLAAVRNG